MIEETGVITKVQDDRIWVQTQIKTTCGGCQMNDNCGTGTIAKALSPRAQTLVFQWHQAARVGQQVKLGIPEQALLGASALIYIMPLLVLVAAALTGQWLLPQLGLVGELWVVLTAFSATGACFIWLKRRLQSGTWAEQFQPQLLRLLPCQEQRVPVQQVNS